MRAEDGRVGLTWNEMDAGWIPIEESWRCSQNAMGFEISKAMAGNSWRS